MVNQIYNGGRERCGVWDSWVVRLVDVGSRIWAVRRPAPCFVTGVPDFVNLAPMLEKEDDNNDTNMSVLSDRSPNKVVAKHIPDSKTSFLLLDQ